MARRPIIIPRHKGYQQQQPNAGNGIADFGLSGADSLAHPLALMNLSAEDQPLSEINGKSIGIRRHGRQPHPQQHQQTPEKNIIKTRMVRKRSPTSVLLPLDFIEEEEGEEEENSFYASDWTTSSKSNSNSNAAALEEGGYSPVARSLFRCRDQEEEQKSVLSSGAVMNTVFPNKQGDGEEGSFLSGFNRDTAEDQERLSEIFDGSIFGSCIEHVDESNDSGQSFVHSCDYDVDDDNVSTGTFRDMMHEQEKQFASGLTTSFESSIMTTSTLERSMELRKQEFQSIDADVVSLGGTPFQRFLEKTAAENKRKKMGNGKGNSNIDRAREKTLQARSLARLIPPEEQRRAVLARYNQIVSNQTDNRRGGDGHGNGDKSCESIGNGDIDEHHLVYEDLERMENEEVNASLSDQSVPGISSPEDSFATVDGELRSIRRSTLKSNAAFRKASNCLSKDLYESNVLVWTLETELEEAKKQRDMCQERYEVAKAKRQKEKEITAIRTLHLEILAHSGANERTRRMLLEHHQIRENGGILGTIFLRWTQKHDTNKGNNTSTSSHPLDKSADASIPSTSPGLIFAGSRYQRNLRENHHWLATINNFRGADSSGREGEEASSSREPDQEGDDPCENMSIGELRVIKNRLEAIKEMFDKARYMVAESSSSSASEVETLRMQRQSQVMIGNAASKYILFRTKNLV